MSFEDDSVLMDRIDALAAELAHVENALTSTPVDLAGDLRERIVGQFEQLIRVQREELRTLRRDLEGGVPAGDCWPTYRSALEATTPLFGEGLDFLAGALVRQCGLDNRLCSIADALLAELSRRSGITWDRFTILAGGDFFAETADIIRIRFPAHTLWDLPVVAHEFGHYAGSKLTTMSGGATIHPLEEILRRERASGGRRERFVHEVFADVFGTYTVGPAYAATSILLHFDPNDAYADGETHPAAAKRVRVVLSTLTNMKDETGDFDDVIERLGESWAGMLRSLGAPERIEDALEEDAIGQVDDWLADVYGIVSELVQPRARYGYSRWLRAQQLAAGLRQGSRSLKSDDTIADVLNGAWHARRQHAPDVGPDALDMCNRIASGRATAGTGA